MSVVEVREATAADWPAVTALLAELGRPDVRGKPDVDDYRAAYDRYLTRPDAFALVGLIDGDVLGLCNLEFRQRLNHLTPEAWIPELVVASSVRSRGLGSALLAHAARLALERGAHVMTLESAHWRTRAHAFYHREGWLDTALSFVRLPDGGPLPRNPRHT